MDDEGVVFYETEDSIDESAENIVKTTWNELKQGRPRMRRGMLLEALELWIERGYVVVPDDYMEDLD